MFFFCPHINVRHHSHLNSQTCPFLTCLACIQLGLYLLGQKILRLTSVGLPYVEKSTYVKTLSPNMFTYISINTCSHTSIGILVIQISSLLYMQTNYIQLKVFELHK